MIFDTKSIAAWNYRSLTEKKHDEQNIDWHKWLTMVSACVTLIKEWLSRREEGGGGVLRWIWRHINHHIDVYRVRFKI